MVLFAASWQLVVGWFGSCIVNVLPECVVSRCTGFGPFHALVPSPCRTCSCVCSTLPLVASTMTSSLLGPSASLPTTVLFHASFGVPSAYVTSSAAPTVSTVDICVRAVASACAFVTAGVRLGKSIVASCATEVPST